MMSQLQRLWRRILVLDLKKASLVIGDVNFTWFNEFLTSPKLNMLDTMHFLLYSLIFLLFCSVKCLGTKAIYFIKSEAIGLNNVSPNLLNLLNLLSSHTILIFKFF
jgi:hypothetical protein